MSSGVSLVATRLAGRHQPGEVVDRRVLADVVDGQVRGGPPQSRHHR